jgi:threonine dehydratase
MILAGQGTVGLEILEDLPLVDSIIVPLSGGSILSGVAEAAKSIRHTVEDISSVPDFAGHIGQYLRREPR